MTITTPEQLGSLLANRRKKLGLSQATLAARIGLSQNRLSVLERESAALTAQQMLALMSVLGLDLIIQERAEPRTPTER